MKSYLLVCLIFACVFTISCGQKERADMLIVGMELSYPPFEMTDERGEPTGVSVDLAHFIGEKIGKEVKIENIAFDGLITALRTNKIDIILSSMTATQERARTIAFSDPYLSTGLCLLLPIDSEVESIEDLNAPGKVVAVKRATTGHIYASKNLPLAELLVVDKESAAVLEVVQKKANAFIYDQMSTFKHWQEHQDRTRAILEPFQRESWAVGLRQEDIELREQINKALSELREEGVFERLGDKYLSEQKEAFIEMGFPFYF